MTRKQEKWTAQVWPFLCFKDASESLKTNWSGKWYIFIWGARGGRGKGGLIGLKGYVPRNRVWFSGSWVLNLVFIERFSYDLEMKTRKQNRDNKQTEIERFDWFIERIQTHVKWTLRRKNFIPENILEIALTSYCNTIGQLIEQCLLHIRVFFGGKTKRPCFDLFIHWLIKQIANSYRNHFFMLYENRSISDLNRISFCNGRP